MAISHLCGFGLNSVNEARQVSGTAASIVSRYGTLALRCNPTAAATSVTFGRRLAGNINETVYQSGRFKLEVASLPTANDVIFQAGASGAATGQVRLNTDGTLSIGTNANATRATSVNAFTVDGARHRVDIDVGFSAGSGIRVYVDDVLWASDTTDAFTAGRTSGLIGSGTAATADLYFSDVVWYDSALPGTRSDYTVSLLTPTSDSAKGGWTDGTGGTTTLYTSVDNHPPVGTTVAGQTAGSTIKSATNSATDDYDATCAAYNSITGLTGSSQILAVQAICNDGQEITTGSPKAGAVVIAANPSGASEQSFDYGLLQGTAGSNTAAAVGTFPAGWGTHVGIVTESPTVTISAGPTVRVGKRVVTTRLVDVDALGVYVMWQAATSLVFNDRPMRRNSLIRR